MLIPNNKYYKIFKIDQNFSYTPTSIQTFGTFYFLNGINEKLNLFDYLENTFKDRTRQASGRCIKKTYKPPSFR